MKNLPYTVIKIYYGYYLKFNMYKNKSRISHSFIDINITINIVFPNSKTSLRLKLFP